MTAADAFASTHGRSPVGVWSAPGRVNLIGEHTDYNAGLVLPFAIDRRTFCAASPNATRLVRASSTSQPGVVELDLDLLDEASFTGWSGYALGVPWAMHRLGVDLSGVQGVDLVIDSEVPLGAGLSSSAAIETAIIAALNELWSLDLSPLTMARIGQLAENGAVGAPTGVMDQVASVFGRREHAVRLDCATMEVQHIPLPLEGEGLTVVVIDSRVRHSHATGGYAERRADCERGAALLGRATLREVAPEDLAAAETVLDEQTMRRVRHVVTENDRVAQASALLAERGPRAIGALMLASHASMCDDFEISVPQIDLAVSAAMEHGAISARLTGGGFGGAAIALVDKDLAAEVEHGVAAAFSAAGYPAPGVVRVVPSDGPLRDA